MITLKYDTRYIIYGNIWLKMKSYMAIYDFSFCVWLKENLALVDYMFNEEYNCNLDTTRNKIWVVKINRTAIKKFIWKYML